MENPIELTRGYNNKFTHPMVVYNRLVNRNKSMMIGISPSVIIDMCGEIVSEVMRDVENMYHLKINIGFDDGKDNLVVKTRLAPVPSFIARIVNVIDSNDNIISHHDFDYNGSYIMLRDDTYNDLPLYIECYTIPFEPKEYVPLIPRGYEQVCYWHCVYILSMELSFRREITEYDMRRIKEEYEAAKANALSSTFDVTRDEYVEIVHIMHDVAIDRVNVVK